MKTRLDLQKIFEELLGSRNVYYQPPSNIRMVYPAIIYELAKIKSLDADNLKYHNKKCYTVTLIHKNPDNDVFDKILNLEYCRFNRHYETENLHHYVFEIYY